MLKTARLFLIVITFPSLFTGSAVGQENQDEYSGSFGLDIGYFLPVGNWTTHRYAEGVDQFQGGLMFGAELEARIFKIPIGLSYNYIRLSVEDWVDYAAQRGDPISASASMGVYGLTVKYYFLKKKPHLMVLELGGSYVTLKGHENFAGYSYDYNFLNPGLGFILVLGYNYLFNEHIALAIKAKALFRLEGISYADGQTNDIIGLPLTAGIKYFF